jgi:acyl phosphate:glycerol-3-phosphate acyltransferase
MIGNLALVVGAYLLGSVPTGLTLGRMVAGVDVRTVGSHRTGATNVQRALGTRAGAVVLLLDFGKGFVAVVAVRAITGNDYVAAIAGLAAVIGHVWPVFAGFRGGRGVATAAGVLAAFAPWALLITLALMIITVAVTRYVSLGSIVAVATAPVLVALLWGHVSPDGDAGLLAAVLVGSLILAKHADNLHRLLHGTESKLGQRSTSGKSETPT